MTQVVLHGALARAVGRAEWILDVATPEEALRGIEANTGRLVAFLTMHKFSEFRVVVDSSDIRSMSEFGELRRRNMKRIDVVPVLQGAGNSGGWLALIGIIIIAAVLFIPSGGASGWATIQAGGFAALSTTQTMFLTLGVALTLGGVSQLLYPTPNLTAQEAPENQPSYVFDGAVNTYRQGGPIPVGFGGPMRVGSQVIAAGVRSVDIPYDTK
jgi:predicted phage tail protein